ncbi:hypothetical protein QYM36_007118 [Artemia franciscana]|uniref:NUDE domain-containing protein n=1 Tax=Artemia franciscana TaxID=6661 RepID=A0AA88HRZ5_ARTSF|nr:hypothetical protein QYM36_007118 [Artemia franciscana]KAK2716861.1 hypothetical protein QYM36_007118 [Artemia franciscana]
MENNLTFSSVDEELKYWKAKAVEYKEGMDEMKEELEEYQTSSKELELELESQLEQAETKCREFRTQSNRLLLENSTLKEKIENLVIEYNGQIDGLQSELDEIRRMRDELVSYVRELEQENDDLERQNRAAVASVEDFETRLNQAIERNAFLESELDEKETLSVMVQRLKDESKELRQELQVRSHNREAFSNGILSSSPITDRCLTPKSRSIESDKLANEYKESPIKGSNGIPLTPSARVSALNLVGDLLRRVGLEKYLCISCSRLRCVCDDSKSRQLFLSSQLS